MLNKQSGQMYGFVTHTFNAIKGECSHDCKYCYMKRWKQKPIRLVESELNTDFGKDNFIFVGSSTDMFAKDVPSEWIADVLLKCNKHPDNKYLFQTKNPERYQEFQRMFPKNTVLGTTIETNDENLIADISKAPSIQSRVSFMTFAKEFLPKKEIMVTIEPVLDFQLNPFIRLLKLISPDWVNVGADSKRHGLVEPTKAKVEQLIKELERFTIVKRKDNLKRLL